MNTLINHHISQIIRLQFTIHYSPFTLLCQNWATISPCYLISEFGSGITCWKSPAR